MDFLYHYTSLETLALILSNKTICFNNLLYVDDIEEAETNDMGKFGRFVYVSCWTDDKDESISLWNLYTPNMHGVRIMLPKFPFAEFVYKKGELFLTEDIKTYINMQKIYDENKVSIVSTQPQLVKLEYTKENDKLYPNVKSESFDGGLDIYLQANHISDLHIKNLIVNYSFKELGKCKHDNWTFQKEWRYIISTMPMGIQDNNPPSFKSQQEIIRRLENKSFEPSYRQIFLDIDEKALEKMEVMFGPRMSEAEKIMAKSILHQYCPTCKYSESALRIR